MPPYVNNEPTPEQHQPDFKDELNNILDSPITPNNIDHYADDALEKLINLTDRVVRGYEQQTGTFSPHAAEIENDAYNYYQLSGVNHLLDYIAQKSNEIEALAGVIEKATVVHNTITPPEVSAAMAIVGGSGSYERPATIPRLKTLLFVLENEFDIKTDDPRQFKLTKGTLRDKMMRRESYYSIETPTLERTALVCDEEGNATFVFDNEKLREYNISNGDLIALTKEDIKDLIEDNPTLGQRIIYSNQFVPNVIKAFRRIKDESESDDEADNGESISYLRPKAPEGYYSINGLAKLWEIAHSVINNAISVLALEDQLGPTESYRFGTRSFTAYSPEQQKMIHDYLVKRESFAHEAPEGYYSVNGLSEQWKVSFGAINNAISALTLEDRLGPTENYRFGQRTTAAYSPQQQKILHDYLAGREVFALKLPEGYNSANRLANKWNIGPVTVYKTISDIEDDLGLVKEYRIGARMGKAYSPQQQKIIYDRLAEKESFTPRLPEGYDSVKGLAKHWNISDGAVNNAILDVEDELGLVEKYKIGSVTTIAYSPEQQVKIYNRLVERGNFAPELPDGYDSVSRLADKWGIHYKTIQESISHLKDQLGPTEDYKIYARITTGYSPEQQRIIKNYIDSHYKRYNINNVRIS